MTVDFSKILGKQTQEIEKPKPLPMGTYVCNNPALPRFIELGQNKTPCAQFNLTVIAPGDDIDAEQLSEYGEWKGKSIRHNMFLTEDSLFRTKEELCNAFTIEEEGKTLGQVFNETVNRQVLVTLTHRPSDDGTTMYVQVEKLAAV